MFVASLIPGATSAIHSWESTMYHEHFIERSMTIK